MNPRAKAMYTSLQDRRFAFGAVPMTFVSPSDGSNLTIMAIDRTSGNEVQLKDQNYPEIKPLIEVRSGDFYAAAIDIGDMTNVIVTLNEKQWRILAGSPKPSPFGDSLGAYFFIVIEAD